MRARGVIGKRIASIEQARVSLGGSRDPAQIVSCLVLEDGTRLEPYTIEGEDEYFITFRVSPAPRAEKR